MDTSGVRRIVVTMLVLSWSLTRPVHAADAQARIARIRVLNPCLKTLIQDATALSSTIRALVARIERSDLIVYIRCVTFQNARLAGRLVFLTAVAGQRYLLIELRSPEQWNVQIATAAHELQHAVEIADAASVQDHATLARYYQQTGITVSGQPPTFDTEAARRIGLTVQRELPLAGPPGGIR